MKEKHWPPGLRRTASQDRWPGGSKQRTPVRSLSGRQTNQSSTWALAAHDLGPRWTLQLDVPAEVVWRISGTMLHQFGACNQLNENGFWQERTCVWPQNERRKEVKAAALSSRTNHVVIGVTPVDFIHTWVWWHPTNLRASWWYQLKSAKLKQRKKQIKRKKLGKKKKKGGRRESVAHFLI